jgi:hypothetical protein
VLTLAAQISTEDYAQHPATIPMPLITAGVDAAVPLHPIG